MALPTFKKAIKSLEPEIREIKNSSPKSPKRLFPWLWRKLRDHLVEAKEDDNATAVDSALKSGPHAALLAEGSDVRIANNKAKRNKALDNQPSPTSQDPALKTEGMAAKAKGKGKGKTAPTTEAPTLEKGPDTRTPEEKAKVPCRFFFKLGSCKFGDNCNYSHTEAPTDKPTKPKEPPTKGQPEAAAKASGGVALVKKRKGQSKDMKV
jgi:hypothetical protein